MSAKRSVAVERMWGGGEGAAAAPLDLAHLSKQTLGDRSVQQEVLRLFLEQARSTRDRWSHADRKERLRLAHTLKGSARSIGAFPVAACLAELENSPESEVLRGTLSRLIDEVSAFVGDLLV
jgi:HPt (histidine-containing phosphotransfer) domain-containing protein